MSAPVPAEILERVKAGHAVERDPPAALTRAERWTCPRCGDAVLRYDEHIYGGATERTCDESIAFWRAT
jgi:adenine-specific DNA methylase